MDKRRIIYTGIELDAESRNLILEKVKIPEGWKTLCHHSTIYFHTSETQRYKEWIEENLGKQMIMIAHGIGKDNKVMALQVMTSAPCANKTKHITLAVSPEGKPVMSNYLKEWKMIEPLVLVGKVRAWYK